VLPDSPAKTVNGSSVLEGDDRFESHFLQRGVRCEPDRCRFAPNAEITVFPWKEPPELKARTINRARLFLKRQQTA